MENKKDVQDIVMGVRFHGHEMIQALETHFSFCKHMGKEGEAYSTPLRDKFLKLKEQLQELEDFYTKR